MSKFASDDMAGWELLRETDKYRIEGDRNAYKFRHERFSDKKIIETEIQSPNGYNKLSDKYLTCSQDEVNLFEDTIYIAESFNSSDKKGEGAKHEAEVVI
jgi:hypothetical protein